MVTQRDIAQELGIAVSTVSRALAGSGDIPEVTRLSVREMAARLGYRKDAHAASLRTGRSGVISLVVGAIDNPFFAELAHHVEQEANHYGLSLMIANAHEDERALHDAVTTMLEQRVDGLILVPVGEVTPQMRALVSERPTVVVDRYFPHLSLDCVTVNPQAAVAELVQHLRVSGYQRPAILAGPEATSTGAARAAIVSEELHAAGWSEVPVMTCPHDVNAAHNATATLCSFAAPDALICGGNVLALGALRALKERRLAVGTEVAVATFDDVPWFEFLQPSLTAITADIPAMARDTVRLLRARMENPEGPIQERIQEARLILRESTGRQVRDHR